MSRQVALIFLTVWIACGSSALGDESADKKIEESALAETRDIISRELFGHYDISKLDVLKREDLRGRLSSERDYGMARVTLGFSAMRNGTRSASLNPGVFEPGKCWG